MVLLSKFLGTIRLSVRSFIRLIPSCQSSTWVRKAGGCRTRIMGARSSFRIGSLSNLADGSQQDGSCVLALGSYRLRVATHHTVCSWINTDSPESLKRRTESLAVYAEEWP
jgi:hypothetical protein